MRAWRQKSQWKAEQAEVLLYADEGHQRCRRSGRLSFAHFKRRVRVARPESLQVGWDGAHFTGAIMPVRSTVDFCQLRSSIKCVPWEWKLSLVGRLMVKSTTALWGKWRRVGLRGVSLRVTWHGILRLWIKGTSEAVGRFTLRFRDVISRHSPCDNAHLRILSNRLTVGHLHVDDRQST